MPVEPSLIPERLGIRSERALIGLTDLCLKTDVGSYGHEWGLVSARAVTVAMRESSPARPTAVMNLIEDRRRRSRME